MFFYHIFALMTKEFLIMRTHRLFQPSLDSMPVRLAPAVMGLHVVVSVAHLAPPTTHGSIGGAHPMDSGEDSGTASPIIIAPVPSTPPSTLLC